MLQLSRVPCDGNKLAAENLDHEVVDIAADKWVLSSAHFVQNASKSPQVTAIVVTGSKQCKQCCAIGPHRNMHARLLQDEFRGHIERRADESESVLGGHELLGDAKVANLIEGASGQVLTQA